jgi:hypothetical protein
MTTKQKLARLIQSIETIVPYVTATLGTGNTFRSATRPDWIEVHGGRASSSANQLESLLREAREMKEPKDGESQKA